MRIEQVAESTCPSPMNMGIEPPSNSEGGDGQASRAVFFHPSFDIKLSNPRFFPKDVTFSL